MKTGSCNIGEVRNNMGRRIFFKTMFSMTALPIGITTVGSTKNPISWVHGNNATIADANGLDTDAIRGNARVVRGRSWSSVPLHFAVPSTGLDTSVPMRVSAVWVRMKTGAGAKIVGMALHDCETTVARIDAMSETREEWSDVRIALNPPREVMRTIGVTLDCEFADVEREISISAVGCEFELA
jgi:hypothetical protein